MCQTSGRIGGRGRGRGWWWWWWWHCGYLGVAILRSFCCSSLGVVMMIPKKLSNGLWGIYIISFLIIRNNFRREIGEYSLLNDDNTYIYIFHPILDYSPSLWAWQWAATQGTPEWLWRYCSCQRVDNIGPHRSTTRPSCCAPRFRCTVSESGRGYRFVCLRNLVGQSPTMEMPSTWLGQNFNEAVRPGSGSVGLGWVA